jgi:Predicted nucleotide-binding protein containing TIR-like domain
MPQKPRRGVPPEPEGEPELLVTRSQMDQELEGQIAQGQELLEQTSETNQLLAWAASEDNYSALRDKYYTWTDYNEQLLRSRFSTGKLADEYRGIIIGFGGEGSERQKLNELKSDINRKMRTLGSIRQRLSLFKSAEISTARDGSATPRIGDTIFIVHGHDGDTKLQVAEFVERVTGERPVILHEQADSGRTIIEKFEEHASEAGFAIILLTADDEGKAKGATRLNPRARQNVVLEFGYFMAKLGRGRVVALHEAGVELPSDVIGVLYKSLAGN